MSDPNADLTAYPLFSIASDGHDGNEAKGHRDLRRVDNENEAQVFGANKDSTRAQRRNGMGQFPQSSNFSKLSSEVNNEGKAVGQSSVRSSWLTE